MLSDTSTVSDILNRIRLGMHLLGSFGRWKRFWEPGLHSLAVSSLQKDIDDLNRVLEYDEIPHHTKLYARQHLEQATALYNKHHTICQDSWLGI